MKNTHDRPYDMVILNLQPDHWGNTGTVRRGRRQLSRSWAKHTSLDYGQHSIPSYIEYIKSYGFLAGDDK